MEVTLEYFAGVDTHRDTHAVAVINSLGELLESFTIEANSAGYAEAMGRASRYPGLIWGLEGTGSYGRSFANALVHEGRIVYEVPGVITQRNRRRLRGPGKSDAQDAHAIAESVLRERATLPRYLELDVEEATRLLYERRDRYVRERTAKVNRIRALALRLQIPLATDLTSSRSLAGLVDSLNATQTSGYAEFEALDEMRDLVTELQHLERHIAKLEERLRPFVERLAPDLLKLRGCAVISAAGILGHMGAIHKYRSADAFAAYAGVAPVQCSSGRHESFRLSTGGNRQLNRCLHNIANVQIRTEDHLGKIYYARKRAEGKTHREAMRCLKRRLATIVFRTLLKAEARGKTAVAPLAA